MISKILLFLFFFLHFAPLAANEPIPCITREQADSMATRFIVYKGRVCLFNTMATEVTKELTGTRTPYGYTPEQVVASWILYPDVWNRAPMLHVRSKALRQRLGIERPFVALMELYNQEGHYRLQDILDEDADREQQLTTAIKELDNKVALVKALLQGQLFQRTPPGTYTDGQLPEGYPSPLCVQWELLNNRFPLFDIAYAAALFIITLLFIRYLRRSKTDVLT